MENLYLEEHIRCINFVQKDKELPIRTIDLEKGARIYEQLGIGRLIIVLRGKITITYSMYNEILMTSCQMFFLPVGYAINISAQENSCIVIVRLDCKMYFCDTFQIEQLSAFVKIVKPAIKDFPKPYFLSLEVILESILHQTQIISDAGYCCRIYFKMKIRELFMMMRFTYTKEQLACFFAEIISADSHFAYKIVHNYQRFHTISELAVFMGMTLHSFERRFRQVFGQSGYKWMNERRKQKVYHAITNNKENFKELSFQFDFSSPAAFNDYCKLHFEKTPGEIRQQAKTINKKIDQ